MEVECPACKFKFKHDKYSNLIAVFCPFCREKISVS